MDQMSRLRAIGIDRDELVWAVFDQSPDCIKVLDLRGNLEYLNPNGQKALELGSADQVLGRYLPDLWPESGRVRLEQGIRAAAAGQKDSFEAWCPTAKGTDRWWQVKLSPICDRHGRPAHILCTSRDITDWHVASEQRAATIDSLVDERVGLELAHQARNQSSVIHALARVSLGAVDGVQARERLMERVGKVLTAIDVVAQSGKSAALSTVVDRTLLNIGGEPRFSASYSGDARVSGESARIVALLLGELESNALAHGALSGAGGSIDLRVEATGDGHVDLIWNERLDNPPAADPASGTGMRLVQRLSSVLPKPADYHWSDQGMRLTFTVEAA